jgi:metal-dependent amidase/aminoacylase/carboxypeptidase family protein
MGVVVLLTQPAEFKATSGAGHVVTAMVLLDVDRALGTVLCVDDQPPLYVAVVEEPTY